jgi:RNase adaptor protein for sRNA GlmZ degradation
MKKKKKFKKETAASTVSLALNVDLLTKQDQVLLAQIPSYEIVKWKFYKGIDQAVQRNQDYFNNLVISSYGIDNGSQPKGSRAFDCRRLNLRGHGLDLRFGRGCDENFQKIATSDHEFLEFIYLVAKCVLENGLTNISFYCSKGHHRSVGAACFFRDTFSPNAKIHHLCLKK